MLAAASDAIIIGFNVRPLADARRAAEREGVEIRTYSVIYKVTEELRAAMEGMLEPEEVEETLGQAEVKELFRPRGSARSPAAWSPTAGSPAPPRCGWSATGTVVWTGRIGSLRRFKDDVQEVEEGLECGDRARGLPGRQGRRRARGVRDQAGREDAGVTSALVSAVAGWPVGRRRPCWSASRSAWGTHRAATPHLVKDIVPGEGELRARQTSKAYAERSTSRPAHDSREGLWRSDGTARGLGWSSDIALGSAGSTRALAGDTLYLPRRRRAREPSSGRSDGTAERDDARPATSRRWRPESHSAT